MFQNGVVHLIGVESEVEFEAFCDLIQVIRLVEPSKVSLIVDKERAAPFYELRERVELRR